MQQNYKQAAQAIRRRAAELGFHIIDGNGKVIGHQQLQELGAAALGFENSHVARNLEGDVAPPPSLLTLRGSVAQEAFEDWDFGEHAVGSHNGWESSGNEWRKVVFIEAPGGGDSSRAFFEVVFRDGGADIAEVTCLWELSGLPCGAEGGDEENEDEEEDLFVNYYLCSCGERWQDVWSATCDDRCPKCDTSISPYYSEDAEDEGENEEEREAALQEAREGYGWKMVANRQTIWIRIARSRGCANSGLV